MPKDFAAKDKRGSSATMQAMRDRLAPNAPRTARLAQLATNPRNPRYDEDDPELKETAATFASVGQLQPLIVVERHVFLGAYPERAEEYEKTIGEAVWVIIIGNRRFKAAQLANLADVDIRVANEITDAEAIEQAILVENLHRKNLPPLLEADLLNEMVSRPGATIRSVGAVIGRSHTYVQQRLDLRGLIPEFKNLVKHDGLGIKPARLLGAMSVEEQQRFLSAGEPVEPLIALHKDIRAAFLAGELDPEEAHRIAALPEPGQREIAENGPPYWAPLGNPVSKTADEDLTPAGTAPASAENVEDVELEGEGPSGEAQEEEQKERRQPQIIIRIADRSPVKIASALRESLTADEVKQLIEALLQ